MNRLCPKCNAVVPNKITQYGKTINLQRRKYCLECSPLNSGNTRKLEIDKTQLKLCCICEQHTLCKKGNVCESCRTTIRRYKIKLKLVEYKGNKCSKCGKQFENLRNYVFHHQDTHDKNYDIAGNAYLKTWEELKSEIDKCVLLCHICHNDIHDMNDSKRNNIVKYLKEHETT